MHCICVRTVQVSELHCMPALHDCICQYSAAPCSCGLSTGLWFMLSVLADILFKLAQIEINHHPTGHTPLTLLRRWVNCIMIVNITLIYIGLETLFRNTHIKPMTKRLSQQTRDVQPMLFECWANVVDGGPTFKQHWLNVSCLLRYNYTVYTAIIISHIMIMSYSLMLDQRRGRWQNIFLTQWIVYVLSGGSRGWGNQGADPGGGTQLGCPLFFVSTLRGTGLESRLGRMFVIGVVHIYTHTVLQTVQRPRMCSSVYGIVHYKWPWSHSIRVGHCPDFGLPSFAIL